MIALGDIAPPKREIYDPVTAYDAQFGVYSSPLARIPMEFLTQESSLPMTEDPKPFYIRLNLNGGV